MSVFPSRPDLARDQAGLPAAPWVEPWPLATWSLIDTAVVFFATFGLVLYLEVIVAGVFGLDQSPARTLILSASQEVLLVAPVLWWMKLTGHGGIERMGLGKGRWSGADVGIGVAAGVGLLFVSTVIRLISQSIFVSIVGHDPRSTSWDRSLPGHWMVPGAVIAVVLAPIAEEFLFRGFLFQGLRRRWSFWPAALLSGTAFATLHGSAVRMPELIVAGVILAALFERRRTLVTPIAAHMTLNLIVVTVSLAAR